jgi:hypothetical protein
MTEVGIFKNNAGKKWVDGFNLGIFFATARSDKYNALYYVPMWDK